MDRHRTAGPGPDGADGLQAALDLGAGRVQVSGELDRVTAPLLLDAFVALDRTDHGTWTVDVAGLTFCDVEGLRVLCVGHDLAVSQDRRLLLINAPSLLRRLVRMCGLSFLMENGSPPPRSLAHRPGAAGGRSAGTRGLRAPVCESDSS